MPNLIVEYQRPPSDETVAESMDKVREIIPQKSAEVQVNIASDPAWKEETRDGVKWLIARSPYKFSSPEQRVVIDPVTVEWSPPEPEPEPEKKTVRKLFSKRKKKTT